jgi:hypothetical protein
MSPTLPMKTAEEAPGEMEESGVGNDDDQQPTDSPLSNQFIQDSFQSLVRVSLAGLGGGIVGMGVEKSHQQRQEETRLAIHERHRASRGRFVPSTAIAKTRSVATRTTLPANWTLSCSFFVLILETARRTSPTSWALQNLSDDSALTTNKYKEAALVSTGNYALGGMVAGLAATVARKTPMRWGVGMGLALGCVAGIVQAGVDVAELYLLDQQAIPGPTTSK